MRRPQETPQVRRRHGIVLVQMAFARLAGPRYDRSGGWPAVYFKLALRRCTSGPRPPRCCAASRSMRSRSMLRSVVEEEAREAATLVTHQDAVRCLEASLCDGLGHVCSPFDGGDAGVHIAETLALWGVLSSLFLAEYARWRSWRSRRETVLPHGRAPATRRPASRRTCRRLRGASLGGTMR